MGSTIFQAFSISSFLTKAVESPSITLNKRVSYASGVFGPNQASSEKLIFTGVTACFSGIFELSSM